MTGATYTVTVFSEHEECRICLDPGLKRRCCGNYYCDDCYYALPACRSCETKVGKKGAAVMFSRAALVAIAMGWMVTFFLVGALTGLFLVLTNNELRIPLGMSSYKCFGFFTTCHSPVCIDLNDAVAMGDEPIPPLNKWKPCTVDSTTKLEALTCIFDEQLYYLTEQQAGYDACMETFPNGVYIFEDTFEHWDDPSNFTSNALKSGKWENVWNGYATNYCGIAPSGGAFAVTFAGQHFRFVETKDLDVSSGGWIEALMYISPPGNDVFNPNCKTNYDGAVQLDYSINGGNSWVMLRNFDPWLYRSTEFFPVKEELPPKAKTSATRFRFIQPAFSQARDAWALDNVRVFRYLPPDWHSTIGFMDNVKEAWNGIQFLQCCFDTDWCVHRLTASQRKQCFQFPWYKGPNYIIRQAEIIVLVVLLANILKFVYVSVQNFFMYKRLPLQDEYEDITKIDRLMKLIPPRYRPKKSLESYASNIHMSARLAKELRDNFNDDEGEGERQERDEEKKAKVEKELKRIRKLKKKLAKRLKTEMDQSTVEEMQRLEAEEAEEAKNLTESKEKDMSKFGALDKMADDMDKFKRQNVAMLRVAFDTKVSLQWRSNFFTITVGLFTLVFFVKLGFTTYCVLHEYLEPFGAYHEDIQINSLGMNFFAMVCDFKELYHTLKFVVPCRDEWVPYITLDLSQDINSLFVGPFIVKLPDVSEVALFPQSFAYACAAAYIVGCFPWCLALLVIRAQYLPYPIARIITPTFGAVMFLRAVLGPGFLVKMMFSLYYVLAFDFKVRESMGVACQSEKTWVTSVNAALMLAIVGAFLCAAINIAWASITFGALFLVGLVYGAVVGFTHELPIRPWMCLTVLEQGTWLRVKKKQACPCLYWGKYCTDMHTATEVFIVYPTDPIKFTGMIQGSAGVGGQG